jgi:pimeloyl-ACP methyl ester carboxylesterase
MFPPMRAKVSNDVRFRSGDLTLAGTFDSTTRPVAASLLIPGSGKVDRNSNTPRLRLGVTAAIAGALRAANICSLRFDKRGVGASEGTLGGLGDNLADARAGLDYLASQAPSLPLFAVGHSEGALHAAELAAAGGLAGVVLLSVAARPGEELLLWQAEKVAATLPAAIRFIARATPERLPSTQRKKFARIRASSKDFIRIGGKRLNAHWLREYLDYSPAPALARITVPVLAITGGHDLQVPPDDLVTIKDLVQGSCTTCRFDDLSHLLRSDPDRKGPRAYRRAVRQPVDPRLLERVTDWIANVAATWRAPVAPVTE